jgi:hypothetical protein
LRIAHHSNWIQDHSSIIKLSTSLLYSNIIIEESFSTCKHIRVSMEKLILTKQGDILAWQRSTAIAVGEKVPGARPYLRFKEQVSTTEERRQWERDRSRMQSDIHIDVTDNPAFPIGKPEVKAVAYTAATASSPEVVAVSAVAASPPTADELSVWHITCKALGYQREVRDKARNLFLAAYSIIFSLMEDSVAIRVKGDPLVV